MSDPIDRQILKDDLLCGDNAEHDYCFPCRRILERIDNQPAAQPDDDRLERCKFEYVNACKILANRTPDTRKKDIDDAYAVIKALHPIFGDVEF